MEIHFTSMAEERINELTGTKIEEIVPFKFLEEVNGKYRLAQEAILIIRTYLNLQIVVFVGQSRIGKSTRCNQLVEGMKKLRAKKPFKVNADDEGVTQGFDAYVIRKSELAHNFGIELDNNNEKDGYVCIIDTEGTENLQNPSSNLLKGLIVVQQIASVIVFFNRLSINASVIKELKKQICFSRILSESQALVNAGLVFMSSDVGIDKDEFQTQEEQEDYRKKRDQERKKEMLNLLDDDGIRIPEDSFCMIKQTEFKDKPIYWNSMKDLADFIIKTLNKREAMSPDVLIDLTNELGDQVSNMDELDGTNISFSNAYSIIMRRLYPKNWDDLCLKYRDDIDSIIGTNVTIYSSVVSTEYPNGRPYQVFVMGPNQFSLPSVTVQSKSYSKHNYPQITFRERYWTDNKWNSYPHIFNPINQSISVFGVQYYHQDHGEMGLFTSRDQYWQEVIIKSNDPWKFDTTNYVQGAHSFNADEIHFEVDNNTTHTINITVPMIHD